VGMVFSVKIPRSGPKAVDVNFWMEEAYMAYVTLYVTSIALSCKPWQQPASGKLSDSEHQVCRHVKGQASILVVQKLSACHGNAALTSC
jgi:hypothetical protein